MKIQYLGTAAAEGWPALFCRCEACENARMLGGKNIRTRSQSIIDDTLLIDMPADTYYHALKYRIDFSRLKDILITHSHEDHFYPLDMILKAPPYAAENRETKKISVYGNDIVVKLLWNAMKLSGVPTIADYVVPVEIKPFETFRAGDYTVTALLADHIPNENCYIYLVEKDGKRLLYAHDTGVFPQKTWDRLTGIPLDAVSLDCTFVLGNNERGHMGLPNVYRIRKQMLANGCAGNDTKFIINHFSHNGNCTHEKLAERSEPLGFLTAYDGFSVEF